MTTQSVMTKIEIIEMKSRSRPTTVVIEKSTVVYEKCCTVRKVAQCIFVFTLAVAFAFLVVVGLWYCIDVIIMENSGGNRGQGHKNLTTAGQPHG